MATQGNTPNSTEIYAASEVDLNFLSATDAANKADLVGGLVPASQLPSYVDDVLEFANLAAFPVTGEVGKIYIALDTEKIYRWATSVYVEISDSLDATEVKSLYESNANTNGVTDTEKTALGNLSGTNTGDQVIPATGVDFDPVGTDNSDDNAVNTLYSGLVSADGSVASHSDVSAAQATAIGNLSGTNSGDEVDASTTVKGIVEKSTSAENVAGTSDTVYPTVAGAKEMIDTHGSAEVDAQHATGVDSPTETSITYVDVPDMSITVVNTVDTTYSIAFTTEVMCSANNSTISFILNVDGVDLPATEKAWKIKNINSQRVVSTVCLAENLANGKVIKARWKTTAPTMTAGHRVLVTYGVN